MLQVRSAVDSGPFEVSRQVDAHMAKGMRTSAQTATWFQAAASVPIATSLTMVGCFGDDEPTSATDDSGFVETAPVIVGPEGGTLIAEELELEFPAGAFADEVEVRIAFGDAPQNIPDELQFPLDRALEIRMQPDDAQLALPAVFRLRSPLLRQDHPNLDRFDRKQRFLMSLFRQTGDGLWLEVPTSVAPPTGVLGGVILDKGRYAVATLKLASPLGGTQDPAASVTPADPPENWEPLISRDSEGNEVRGAGSYEMRVMYGWYQNPSATYTATCSLRSCFLEYLPDLQQEDFSTRVAEEPDFPTKLRLAADLVQQHLSDDPNALCRHHAIALQEVLRDAGIESALRCGRKSGEIIGHAWIEVTFNGDTYLLDAFSQHYVKIVGPKPTGVPPTPAPPPVTASEANPNASPAWTFDFSACAEGDYPQTANSCGDATTIDEITLSADEGRRFRWNGNESISHPRPNLPFELWGLLGSYQCGLFCSPDTDQLIRDCWGGPERTPICRQEFTRTGN